MEVPIAGAENPMMGIHAILVAAVGTSGVLLHLAGLRLMVRPRRLWSSWFRFEQRWRASRFGGEWTRIETASRRRGYFWIPRRVELRRPEDVYSYALSDRFWRSPYAWCVRLACWYGGALLILSGFVVLGFGLLTLP